MMPEYDSNSLMNATAVSASGTQSVYEYVARVGDLGTPEAVKYSEKYTGLYHELQASQDRTRVVRDLVGKLNNPKHCSGLTEHRMPI
jgi:hypothetical protein